MDLPQTQIIKRQPREHFRTVSDESRAEIFTLAAETERLRSERSSLRAQLFMAIVNKIDSREMGAIIGRIDDIEAALKSSRFTSLAKRFGVAHQYVTMYLTRYMSGQSVKGRGKITH